MKFKILSRSETEHTRARRDDMFTLQRNLDAEVHPFQQEREYARALRAAKLERHFAKPLVGVLEGHTDAIWSMALNPRNLVALLSGSCDGEIRLWDIPAKKIMWRNLAAHTGFVRGLSVCAQGDTFLSCGDDKLVKVWSMNQSPDEDEAVTPLETFVSENVLTNCDAHPRLDEMFVTCGDDVAIWDKSRPEPVHAFSWGADSVVAARFNPSESNLLGGVGKSDRSIVLYDVREKLALKKIIQPMRNNSIAWNPMEPFHFTTANEDYCLYTFDMRRLNTALIVHKDHVSAVLDVHYSPTGKEFVSGSYDRSVRIFSVKPGWESKGRSREVYTAPRMQRVFCTRFSGDAHYVFSGSDDGNVRVWKSEASRPMGVLNPKQKLALEYNSALLSKFKRLKEIRTIHNKRILPKSIYKEAKKQLEMKEAERRKKLRVMKHAKNTEVKRLRDQAVLKSVD